LPLLLEGLFPPKTPLRHDEALGNFTSTSCGSLSDQPAPILFLKDFLPNCLPISPRPPTGQIVHRPENLKSQPFAKIASSISFFSPFKLSVITLIMVRFPPSTQFICPRPVCQVRCFSKHLKRQPEPKTNFLVPLDLTDAAFLSLPCILDVFSMQRLPSQICFF